MRSRTLYATSYTIFLINASSVREYLVLLFREGQLNFKNQLEITKILKNLYHNITYTVADRSTLIDYRIATFIQTYTLRRHEISIANIYLIKNRYST